MPLPADIGLRARRVLRRGTVPVANARALRQIARAQHPRAPALAEALRRALRGGGADAEEERWIARIEATRRELEHSDEILRTEESEWSGNAADRAVLEETVGECCRTASKPARSALVLFQLVRTLRPRTVVELGTCLGVSTSYQAAALRLNGEGRLATFEASRARVDVARRTVGGLGLDGVDFHPGRFQDTLGPALAALPTPVDYAFVDGHHEEDPTIAYLDEIAGHAEDGAVLVFDDIHWSPGMEHAWTRIVADARVALAVDVGDMGICLMGPNTGRPPVTVGLWHVGPAA
jgi:predicted O-methyltransferase YrrM